MKSYIQKCGNLEDTKILLPEFRQVTFSDLSNTTFAALQYFPQTYKFIVLIFFCQHNVLYCDQISTLYFKQPCYLLELKLNHLTWKNKNRIKKKRIEL